MRYLPTIRHACVCMLFCGLLTASQVKAQSGTRIRSTAPPMPTNIVSQKTALGLEGFCPVCVVEMKQWIKGKPSIQLTHDGKTYYFPGEKQRDMFVANPAKYAPSLGGDCSVCLTDMKQRMAGSVQFSALHKGRLFLFPNQDIKAKFLKDPAKYANADLAFGGDCAVCRTEMKQKVAGKTDFAALHKGKRYLFPSEDQRKMFFVDPDKYAEKPEAATVDASR